MAAKSQVVTLDEWRAEATRLFGEDEMQWRWRCPACGHECSTADYQAAGAKSTHVGFSCVGRFLPAPRDAFGDGPGPCNYAGGGLIGLNPIRVLLPDGKHVDVFAFGSPVNAEVQSA